MRWPRWSIRRLMIVVAVAALVMRAEQTGRRWSILADGYRQKASEHSLNLVNANTPIREMEKWRAILFHPSRGDTPSIGRCRRLSEHYRSLVDKYSRAAWFPWVPVVPDPPEPK